MPEKKVRTEHRLAEGRHVQNAGARFSKNLLLWRTKKDWTHKQCGQEIGCHAQAIRNVEEGRNFPSWSLYVSLCKLMGVEPVPGMPEEQ